MHWHWPLTASPQVHIAGQVQVTDAHLRGGPLYRNFSRSCSVVGVISNVSGQTKICNLIRDNRIRSEWLSVVLTNNSTLHYVSSIIQLRCLFSNVKNSTLSINNLYYTVYIWYNIIPYVYKFPWTYIHTICNVFCKSAHNCEIEMQTFSGHIAVIQLSEALSFRHLSCDKHVYLLVSSRDPMAFT